MTAAPRQPLIALASDTYVHHDTLWEAFAAAQAEFPRIGKGNTADVRSEKGSYSYRYADLSDVLEAVTPVLLRHGLFWTAKVDNSAQGLGTVLRYALVHAATGERDEGTYPLPDPTGRITAQQVGSAITYARRYALVAHLNLVVDEDDDAASVNARPAADPAREQPVVPTVASPELRGERAAFYQHRLRDARTPAMLDAVERAATAEQVLDVDLEWGERGVMSLGDGIRGKREWLAQREQQQRAGQGRQHAGNSGEQPPDGA